MMSVVVLLTRPDDVAFSNLVSLVEKDDDGSTPAVLMLFGILADVSLQFFSGHGDVPCEREPFR